MDCTVYYFSGTGNCLHTARALSVLLDYGCVSIAEVMRRPGRHDFGRHIVIVFPSYLAMVYGVPVIVKEFAEGIPEPASKRISLVCSCGGYEAVNAVPSAFFLERVIRSAGGRVFSIHTLRQPMNNLDYDHIPIPIERDEAVINRRAEKVILRIGDDIRHSRPRVFKRFADRLLMFLLKPMFLLLKGVGYRAMLDIAGESRDSGRSIEEVFRLTDRGISADDSCNGCGTCVRVCPVGNISLVGGKPVWNHGCEMCLTCHEWCPQKSISHWGRKEGVYYRHPAAVLKDFTGADSGDGR